MTSPRPVAFYAPLKSPDHDSPSGDRTMARLLLRALEEAGFTPTLASRLRTHDKIGDAATQARLEQESRAEADRLIAHYRALPRAARPVLWFTYHVYYKAPDWIGPRVAEALAIPYAIAEGSRALKRAEGSWSLGHRGAEAALGRANLIFSMTATDRPGLEDHRPAHQVILDLPPFLDETAWAATPPAARRIGTTPRLLTVAMMRAGDKRESYRILSAALLRLRHCAWTLDIVGDGEARADIEAMFAAFGKRVRFHGVCDRQQLKDLYQHADMMLWPAVNEAYGMVFLEAQLFGNAVVAGDHGGVASVVQNGRTGLLAPAGDNAGFARCAARLLRDPLLRHRMGESGRAFVIGERNLAQAAGRLRAGLLPLIGGGDA